MALLLACGGSVCHAAEPNTKDRPNVLFIAIDDQNDWLGCLGGHPQAITPNLDALAERGTLFIDAHCQSPLCNSSRTSVMLGLRPTTTGIYGLGPWFLEVPALRDSVSLPKYFSQRGYRTLMAGKIYHSHFGRAPGREFDVIGPAANPGPFPKQKLVDTPTKNPWVDWGLFDHRDEDKGDYKVASWAIEQLEHCKSKPDEPFFLSVGFFLPHVPCYATQKWFDMYPEHSVQLPLVKPGDRDDTPRFSWYMHWKLPEPRLKWLQENHQWRNLVRSYMACTSFTDHQVGRVLRALEEKKLAENTIVVLWSDHGYHLGEKLMTGKTTLWHRSTHVPLIFAGPGIASGARPSQPVELLDIYPTLLDLCGLPAKKENEGISLRPQLTNANAKRERPALTSHNPGNHAVKSERWRYILYADGSDELYDTHNDPNEWTNIAHRPESKTVIAEHRRWLPESSAPHAPGSHSRILTYIDGQANWEGQDISPEDPIPQ